MKLDDWSPPLRIEENYRSALSRLMEMFNRMLQGVEITNPYEVVTYLRAFVNGNFYPDYAMAAASRMVTGLAVSSARTWRDAARESMKGGFFLEALQREMQGPVGARVRQIVEDNARLIRTFPDVAAKLVTSFIRQETEKGRRAEDIAVDLKKQFYSVTKARLNLIARTEVSKASTALNRAHAESLGLDWYVWRTSKDARVRSTHRHMDGVIVNWHEPPAPEALMGQKSKLGSYHAGDSPNCRCFPQSLLRMNQVQWPHKVFMAGAIRMMTYRDFARIAGAEVTKNAA
jgi:SPP1 gp7 family putative phage head morphogenesis protein